MNRHTHAFTLLELILAVTITAVVSVVLFTSLSIAFETRERAEDQLADLRSMRAALDLVVTDLGSVPAPTGKIAGPFVGTNERMGAARDADAISYFTSAVALPTDSDLGDVRGVELSLANDPSDPDAWVLVRYVTSNPLASTLPEPTPQVIARGVISFNARYFDGGDWLDEWDSAEQDNELPNAVELTLTVRPQRQRVDEDDFDEDHLHTFVRLVPMPAGPQPETNSGGGGFGSGGLLSF